MKQHHFVQNVQSRDLKRVTKCFSDEYEHFRLILNFFAFSEVNVVFDWDFSASNDVFDVFHATDSRIWLLRSRTCYNCVEIFENKFEICWEQFDRSARWCQHVESSRWNESSESENHRSENVHFFHDDKIHEETFN